MEKSVLSERFGELFISYVKSPKEEHLSEISELGRSLVMCSIPPEDIADIFEESLILLTRDLPGATLLDTAERISTPLTEMLIGYGIAFREQLAQRQNYENTKLATKVIENALEGIWVADSKGQILIANPVFSHLTGYSLEEAVGQNFIIFHDFCSARENSEMWESIEKNGWWKAEVCGRRKNSETFSALLSISVIRDESLRILNYIGFLSDITERKRHEEITALEISRARQIHDQVTQCRLPLIDGIEVDIRCLPAEKIGGDVIDISKTEGGNLLIFLADVTGHGISAAMTANAIKMLFNEISSQTCSPSELCTRLNKAIRGNILPDDTIAVFCGLVDSKLTSLTYCLAGLPRPALLRSNNLTFLAPTGTPLGIFPDYTCPERTIELMPGDIFAAFTDGITESGKPNAVFGKSGVQRSLSSRIGDCHTAVQAIFDAAVEHQGRRVFVDDVIALAFHILDAGVLQERMPLNIFCTDQRSVFATKTRHVDIDEILKTVIEHINSYYKFSAEETIRTHTALFEMLTNALEHGNLVISDLKKNSSTYDTPLYWKTFDQRKKSAEYGERPLCIECDFKPASLLISIEDGGEGFNPKSVADPTDPGNCSLVTGRGILLSRMLIDNVWFNSKGNKVYLRKTIRPCLEPIKPLM